VLTTLLASDAGRTDVRLELAQALLQSGDAKGALAVLVELHNVTPEDAARYFRLAVYAHLNNHDADNAVATALHFRNLAKTAEDREEADRLVSLARARNQRVEVAPPVATVEGGRPTLQRREPGAIQPPGPPPPVMPTVSGRFMQLDCKGPQAHMIVETPAGKKVFLINDPGKVAILGGSDGPIDMTCGVQKNPRNVEVGYSPLSPSQPGLDGIVKTLTF